MGHSESTISGHPAATLRNHEPRQISFLPQTWTNTTTVHASLPSNTFAIYGNGEEKELTELVPGILNQLGPDSLASLRKLAESYQSMQKAQGEDGEKKDDDDDEDIPELVAGQDFESGDKKEEADVE